MITVRSSSKREAKQKVTSLIDKAKIQKKNYTKGTQRKDIIPNKWKWKQEQNEEQVD